MAEIKSERQSFLCVTAREVVAFTSQLIITTKHFAKSYMCTLQFGLSKTVQQGLLFSRSAHEDVEAQQDLKDK